MTNRKVILYSLGALICFAILIFLSLVLSGHLNFGRLFLLIFLALIIWVAGVFLGVIISAIARQSTKEQYFYLSGQIISTLIVIAFIGWNEFKELKQERDLGNIEDNHRFVHLSRDNPYDPNYNRNYIRTAFIKLESTFSDPNSFYLTRSTTEWKDTVINSTSDTLYTIYFTYLHKHDERFAKLNVFKDSAVIKLLNVRTKENLEYQAAILKADQMMEENIQSINKSLAEMPDSARRKILDTIKQALVK